MSSACSTSSSMRVQGSVVGELSGSSLHRAVLFALGGLFIRFPDVGVC